VPDDGLSPGQERLLASLLDVILPASPDGRLPGAAALDLAAHVVRTVQQTAMLRPLVEYGLSTIEELARTRSPAGFTALSASERTALLEEFARTDQFFLPAFLYLAYSGYYGHPTVVAALGLEPRAPHPKGHRMEEDDLSLLDPVRRRGPRHRA
jgi:Gluconate 2-dehydrogenase subunit 3